MIALYTLNGLDIVLLCLTLPPLTYLAMLTGLSWQSGKARRQNRSQRFVFVVPAHNEEAGIASTVQSLLAVDYPKELASVLVVADNCSDATAERARAAGARVLERVSATERGKGYALDFAFAQVLAEGHADAVVVVDADSVVSPNVLGSFAARLADGELAMQAEYGVRNPLASWRTRLMAVALGMFHRVRGLGRERLGLSCGLRGNGMCFALACLRRFPHKAHGLVEDVEYGIALGKGGVRVAYVDEAKVNGEMVSGGQASESQRARWEEGRRSLWQSTLPDLLRAAIRGRSALLFDLAVDLAIPPLGRIGAYLLFGSIVEALRLCVASSPEGLLLADPTFGPGAAGGGLGLGVGPSTVLWALAWLFLGLYVVRGMVLSHLGFGAITAMAGAPFYLGWKVLLQVRKRLGPRSAKGPEWVRTAREVPGGASSSPVGTNAANAGPKAGDTGTSQVSAKVPRGPNKAADAHSAEAPRPTDPFKPSNR